MKNYFPTKFFMTANQFCFKVSATLQDRLCADRCRPVARFRCTNGVSGKRRIHLVEYLHFKKTCDYETLSKPCI